MIKALVRYDIDKYSEEEVREVFKLITEFFPEFKMICLPSNFTIDFIELDNFNKIENILKI